MMDGKIEKPPALQKAIWVGWALLILTPIPALVEYSLGMWRFEHYHFLPVLALAVASLVFFRWDRNVYAPAKWSTILLLVVSGSLIVAGIIVWSPWITVVGWYAMVCAWLTTHLDREFAGSTLIAIAVPLLLLIRLPLNLDISLIFELQKFTSNLCSLILDAIPIAHDMEGNVFRLDGKTLFVEDACSGVQSLFSLLFISLLILAWKHRPIALLPVYACAAVFWAILMNILRILAIVFAHEYFSFDLSHGWQHEIVGYVCLFLAIGLMLSTDRLLAVIFYPVPASLGKPQFNPATMLWNWTTKNLGEQSSRRIDRSAGLNRPLAFMGRCFVPFAIVFALVSLGYQTVHFAQHPQVSWMDKFDLIISPQKDIILAAPPQLEVIEYEQFRDGTDPRLGPNADVWKLRVAGVPTRVVISQTFPEFHDLASCYKANGWHMNEKTNVQHESDGWQYVTAEYIGPQDSYGYLLYSGLQASGDFAQPIDRSLSALIDARLYSERGVLGTDVTSSCLMIQGWTVSSVPLSRAQRDALVETHLSLRATIRQELEGSR